ncbi:LysR family transcriptional regulator [Vibrio sp. T187]|uniref:LysR family transcriptional regulator n=1 Tax=Vibrio TaxID=662 RepID=UPI0010C9E8E0|nr:MULTISPECIES: LysR family transcriptional regulator [Vibrio]MBW3694254.1 LysR family transcriptional regulator [Vibrio sp. T187]
MSEFNWKGVDLNLLVAFMALYETGSVTAAADRVFVSQSAMSHSLSRLRDLLKDKLFERKGHKMQPTERAEQVAPIVQQVLTQLQFEVFTVEEFYPDKYQGVCKIGLTDYAEQIFAPAIFDAINHSSPLAKVSFIHANRHNYQQLLSDENVDVIIGSFPSPDNQLVAEHLYTERHVCMYDPQQIELQEPFGVDQFVQYPHALVSPDGKLKTQVDAVIGEQGLARRVAVASRNFMTIRSLISGRQLMCIVPELMAKIQFEHQSLATTAPPLNVADFDISLLYRRDFASYEKNIWLRELVKVTLSEQLAQLKA